MVSFCCILAVSPFFEPLTSLFSHLFVYLPSPLYLVLSHIQTTSTAANRNWLSSLPNGPLSPYNRQSAEFPEVHAHSYHIPKRILYVYHRFVYIICICLSFVVTSIPANMCKYSPHICGTKAKLAVARNTTMKVIVLSSFARSI